MNKSIKTFLLSGFCLLLPLHSGLAMAALPIAIDGKTLPSLAPMLEQVTPAVVNIATEGKVQIRTNPLFSDPFFRRFFNVPDQAIERKTQSLGSGVIVDAKRGLVLTNNHVIANAVQITVTLRDSRQLEAELVGTDPETDVAVIKIDAEHLIDIKIADSDALKVGDFVVAIGNPFGLGQTVTSGIVSALSRSGLGIEGYEDFIQTDASINPGNSGGALVNLNGDLVGINTAIFSRSGGNIGIGFAIPINLAMQIAEQLLKTGTVKRGFFGISVQDLNPSLVDAFGLDKNRGAVITNVIKGSPSEEAGLQPGDIVININSREIKNASDVRNQVGLLPVGNYVVLDILRGGKKLAVKVQVSSNQQDINLPTKGNKRLAGVSIDEISADSRYYNRLKGVSVAAVERGSLAWRSGLRQGDIITSVNHYEVEDVQTFINLINGKDQPLLLRIIRGNSAAFIVI